MYPKIGNCSNNYQGDLIFTAKNISFIIFTIT